MPKTPKIDVITVKLTCHIPVNRNNRESVDTAYGMADGLIENAEILGLTTADKRLNRVTAAPEPTAPEPEPEAAELVAAPPDNLVIPDNLRRVSKSKAEAESA